MFIRDRLGSKILNLFSEYILGVDNLLEDLSRYWSLSPQ